MLVGEESLVRANFSPGSPVQRDTRLVGVYEDREYIGECGERVLFASSSIDVPIYAL